MRDSCDLDTFEVYTEKLVRARKPHLCCETGRTIAAGELHWVCRGLGDGHWQVYRQSWAAYRLARALNFTADGGLACWIPFGGLHGECANGAVARAEWDAIARGEITRPPVGDELERLARWGVEAPPVAAVAIEQEDDDA